RDQRWPEGRSSVRPSTVLQCLALVHYTRMRSPPGEHSVDGHGAGHRGQAIRFPGEAEAGPVDAHLGVEPDFPLPGTDATASKDSGRVRPRTVSAPVTAAPWPEGRIPPAKVMCGWLPLAKTSAART